MGLRRTRPLEVKKKLLGLLFVLLMSASLLGCQGTPEAAAEQSPLPPDAAAPLTEIINHYAIETAYGRMVIRLYDETPGHRDNFQRLAEAGFYDRTLFHRVIQGFMIQGGDPNSLDENPYNDGNGGPGYMIDAEFKPELFHKRGAVAAARMPDQANPRRMSSGSQFYIVHGGTPYPAQVLAQVEMELRQQIPDPTFVFSDSARAAYTTIGGAPNLDGMYTVFGEVVEGFDVLDRIATVDTPRRQQQSTAPQVFDRPFADVPMTVRPLPDYAP